MKQIITSALSEAMDYGEYRELISRLRQEEKTTGHDQSAAMLHYTDLNIGRMNKWDKRYTPDEESIDFLRQYSQEEIWLVISEAWCGDAAHSLPVMAHFEDLTPCIHLRIVLRDDNPDLMNLFLSEGKRSIPKLIRLKADNLDYINSWGSRPQELQQIFQSLKSTGLEKSEISRNLQLWYARNRGKAIEKELISLMKTS